MKFISTLMLLLVPAMAMATDEDRGLQMADWHVTITSVTSQGFEFNTGAGTGGNNVNIKIHVNDICRLEGATRVPAGDFYPTTNVLGIDADGAGMLGPGQTNSIDWSFVEGINGNTAIYTDNLDNTATVEFCALVGLYEDTVLIDYAETKMTYTIDLVTNIPALTGYTVTQAEAFNDAADTAITFDGTLNAYFCNETTKEILTDNGAKTHQGSILHVCFKVPDGQFEVADVMDLTVTNAAAATPTQAIITNSAPASSLYSTKDCTDVDGTDTNVCLVSFLLKADFYDFTALTLTGTGSVLLEFGDASGSRRRLRRKLSVEPVEESFQVTAQEFEIDQLDNSGATSAATSLAAFAAIAGAALVL